jgi:hypothetical protein
MHRLASCRYPLRTRTVPMTAETSRSHPLYSAPGFLNFSPQLLRRGGKPFSWPLPFVPVAAILLAVFFATGAPVTAQIGAARTDAFAPGRIGVAVLDFDVAPGLDPVLGRKAADAVAVELGRSGEYEVVPRQRMEEVLSTISGLRPPYTPLTQIHLAQSLNVNNVVTGEVVSAVVAAPTTLRDISNRRGARVQINVRQLEAISGDLTIGARVAEVATSAPREINIEVDADLLVDDALNKAAFSAVRSIRQTRLVETTILNTTVDFVEMDRGFRNGVRPGQRYTVLRDVLNRSRTAVERIKVGEITIRRVEDDQAQGQITAGGIMGIRTGDKARRIYVPGSLEVLPSGTLTPTRPSYQQNVTPYEGSQARGAITSRDRSESNGADRRGDEMGNGNAQGSRTANGQRYEEDDNQYYITADGRVKRREQAQE